MSFFDAAAGFAVTARVLLPHLFRQPPCADSVTIEQRIAAVPRQGLPLRGPAVIHWNQHHVPFIEADNDLDCATAFGTVHVHLRWTQMEIMRRVARGHMAEMLGPLGIPMDRALRTLNFGRAVPAIADALPAETRQWLSAYLGGVNHAIAHAPLPPDFGVLGLGRDPWTLRDVLSVGRLAGADATWMVWTGLLPMLDDPSLAPLMRRLLNSDEPPNITPASGGVAGMLSRTTRQASNAMAVAPTRSATGAAWLAGDTHLPALLPNLWLLAGCRTPSLHCVGLMVPGVPAMLVGRTPHIAWGGTNLHAASSDLFDVTDVPESAIATRHEILHVRGTRDRTIAIRETNYGPIVSDLPMLKCGDRRIALRWMGHSPSDEITALLRVARSHDWQEFRAALHQLSVPGQNIVYADSAGHIGKAMAVHLPARRNATPDSLLSPRNDTVAWDSIVTGSNLPASFDPAEGFVASANDKPGPTNVPVGWFFASGRRIGRLTEMLRATPQVGFADIAAMQQDITMPTAGPVRDRLLPALRRHRSMALLRALEPWDLRYDPSTSGALAFELLLYHLAVALHDKRRPRLYSSVWNARGLVFEDIMDASDSTLAAALRRAAPKATHGLRRHRVWGKLHRQELQHFLGSIPLPGRRYRFGNAPASGGNDTLWKSGNKLTGRRHRSPFASTARQICDMSDPDNTWFVLLGGQDGWLGSTTLLDQSALFRDGRYIRMPLRLEAVRAEFPFRTELSS